MNIGTRITLLCLLLAGFACTTQTSDNHNSQKSTIFFEHGFRGNPDRYFDLEFHKLCWQHGDYNPLTSQRADAIPETLSKQISSEEINKKNWPIRWFAKLKRELVLFFALRRSALAQDNDLMALERSLQANKAQQSNFIFVGHSNGAAIGLNSMQSFKWRAGIFFTPFCHGGLAFRGFPPVSALRETNFNEKYIVPLLRKISVPRYKHHGRQPLNLAQFNGDDPNNIATFGVNKKTPLLIISVKNDPKVPQYHQFALYIALKEAGYEVYFYEVEHGDHEYIMTQEQRDSYPEEYNALKAVVQGFRSHVERNTALPKILTQRSGAKTLHYIQERLARQYNMDLEMLKEKIAQLA
jgi:predicted esterase